MATVPTKTEPPKPNLAQAKQPSVASAVKSTAKEMIKDAIFEKRPYLKMAFANPYNLSLLLGGIAASVLTANPIPAVVALGAEGLWLLHAPENKTLRRLLWDPRFEKVRLALEAQEREQRMRSLPDQEKSRVYALVEREQEINRLAAQNPSFTGDLLRTELVKTHKLVDSFLEMALTCARYERYLDSVDINALERDKQRWQGKSSSDRTPDAEREISKKNYEVILKRTEKIRDIRNYLGVARAQLDLIENSFQLIADQIVTMQSPAELSGQLDDLLDGVDSIRQTAVDTEKILGALET
jgi:hypothetical protein